MAFRFSVPRRGPSAFLLKMPKISIRKRRAHGRRMTSDTGFAMFVACVASVQATKTNQGAMADLFKMLSKAARLVRGEPLTGNHLFIDT